MKRFYFLGLILILIAITNYSCKKCEGCTNPKAENYNKDAEVDDGTCILKGCTNPKAENYDPQATVDNNSCIIKGCTNPKAENYDASATIDDGFCLIKGCTNPASPNYDPEANVDDGSCVIEGCTDPTALNYSATATIDNGTCKYPKDLFIGNYTVTLECDDSQLAGLIEGQMLDIKVKEIAGEKKKVNITITLPLLGDQEQEGNIDGSICTFVSPERVITLPQLGEAKISTSGNLVSGSDPNILTGMITITVTTAIFPIPIVTICSISAKRK